MKNEENDNRVALSSVCPEIPEGLIQTRVKDKELLERLVRRYGSSAVTLEVFIELIEYLGEYEAWGFIEYIMSES